MQDKSPVPDEESGGTIMSVLSFVFLVIWVVGYFIYRYIND